LVNGNFVLWVLGFSITLGAVGDFIYVFLIFKVGLIILNDDVKVKNPNE